MNNKEKQIRKEFKKLVIMGNHVGKSYEEALEEELTPGCIVIQDLVKKYKLGDKINSRRYNQYVYRLFGAMGDDDFCIQMAERIENDRQTYEIIGLPITIGRVMQALQTIDFFEMYTGNLYKNTISIRRTIGEEKSSFICDWKLTKENGQECTDDDQTLETIEKLTKLFKK